MILQRGVEKWFCPTFANFSAQQLACIAEELFSILPPCVKAAVWNTWLNGWPTAKRFQQSGSSCLLCREGEDSIEHYSICKVQWAALKKCYPYDIEPVACNFLLVGSLSKNEKIALACHMYATRTATNAARKDKSPWQSDRAIQEVLAGHKTTMAMSNEVRRHHAVAWKQVIAKKEAGMS